MQARHSYNFQYAISLRRTIHSETNFDKKFSNSGKIPGLGKTFIRSQLIYIHQNLNSTHMNKRLLLPLFPLLLINLPAAAEDREWVPYKKFVEKLYLDKFYGAPAEQRDKVRLRVKIKPANKNYKQSDLTLTVIHAGIKEAMVIDPDGAIDLTPNQKWINEDAMIYTNLPKGEKSSVMSSFEAKMPEGLQVDYSNLMGSVTQWNSLIKEYAGMLRFLAPTFTGVDFHFAKAAHQSVQVMTRSGPKTFTADDKGDVVMKLDETLMKENPVIVMSERPSEIGMTDD